MSCEKCNGTGFIAYTENGYQFAKECDCRAKMITEIRLKASGISEAFQRKTLDGFDTKGHKTLIDAKNKAVDFVNNYGEYEKNVNNSIMFLGTPGCGKTHLSLAIANKLLNEQGVGCLYMPYRETMTELKQLNMSLDKKKYDEMMYKLTTARLLIIDDLYKGSVTEADLNYIFQIINQRYLNQLPFICSSEKRVSDILGYDEAIGSRLIEQAKNRIVYIEDKRLNHRI